jgi:ADP-heptose:LPS heptosyltransferase
MVMKIFRRTFELPFQENIPNYIDAHLKEKNIYKRFFKFFKRYIFIALNRQANNEVFSINESHKKILWINISAPSLGDSLMDLSSRILLKGRVVDLFTDKKNSHLYLSDQIFEKVYTDKIDIKIDSYDLIILDSYSTRSVKVKSKIAPNLKYVGMYGYFNGPEVHRILFSFNRMNQLLGLPIKNNQISKIANNLLSISKSDRELVADMIPKNYVAIVLGGEWSYRSYNKWDEVIDRLVAKKSNLKIVFIGSNNAIEISDKLFQKFPKHHIMNLVNKLSFNQTVEVIRRSKITLCCDGGLLHGAVALDANVLALFARLRPEILLTKNNFCHNIYNDSNVNNISPDTILSKYYDAMKFIESDSKD